MKCLSTVLRLILCVILIGFCWFPLPSAFASSTQLTWLKSAPGDLSGFRKATAPRNWHFPADFGPHEAYQTEWWYYTGNLTTAEGRPLGFQLTFFRQALTPSAAQTNASHWRNNQIYSAHFTVSDIAQNQFYPADRFSRAGANLAGASAQPYQVWLEDWSATEIAPGKVQLQAKTSDVALDLVVEQNLPPVLHGDRGLFVKGIEPGNASYYYSLVQQPTTGTVTIQGRSFAVTGATWKDHEYATDSLSLGTVGWNWFSMQFDNGTALMLYLLQHEDGTLEPTSAGTYIAANGKAELLSWQDWQVTVLETWRSPKSKAVYPARWSIAIPKLDLTLQVTPLMPDQELRTATATYWEGAVASQGIQQGQSLQGKGYVELTGYADRLDAVLSARTPS